jgi:hypothetical protein
MATDPKDRSGYKAPTSRTTTPAKPRVPFTRPKTTGIDWRQGAVYKRPMSTGQTVRGVEGAGDHMYNGLERGYAYEARKAGAAPLGMPPGPAGPGGGGSGGGWGGGGGGGGQADKENALRQIAGLLELMKSGAFTAKADPALQGQITQGVAADRAAAGGTYNALDAWLAKNQGNPYQDMQLQAMPQLDAGLAALLQSQGSDSAGYQAQVGMANTLGAQTDVAGQNLKAQLAAQMAGSNQSRLAESQQARAYADQSIGAQERGMQFALQQRVAQQQEAMNQQKLQLAIQLMQIAGQSGLDAPTLAQMGMA